MKEFSYAKTLKALEEQLMALNQLNLIMVAKGFRTFIFGAVSVMTPI